MTVLKKRKSVLISRFPPNPLHCVDIKKFYERSPTYLFSKIYFRSKPDALSQDGFIFFRFLKMSLKEEHCFHFVVFFRINSIHVKSFSNSKNTALKFGDCETFFLFNSVLGHTYRNKLAYAATYEIKGFSCCLSKDEKIKFFNYQLLLFISR